MSTFFMQPFPLWVAGPAVYQRGFFPLFEMACIAVCGHHGSGCRDLVTLRATQNRGVSQLVATVAEEIGVFPPQFHGVPGFFLAHRRRHTQGKERSPLGLRVTGGTGPENRLSGIINMLAVVAHKAARPGAMAYVVGIRQPVHLHSREDTPVIEGDDGLNRLIDERSLRPEDLRIFFGVEPLDRLPDLLGCGLPIRVFSD